MADGLRVLYVDDEPELLEMAKIFLEMDGEFQVSIAPSAKEVIGLPLARTYDAIISDYEMPVMNGIAFLKHVREQFGDIPFILFTGRGREEVVIDAINNGADFYLQKGGSARAQFAELAHKIRQAVMKRQAQAELRDAHSRITASREELARSEQQLQESESKFRSFADHLPQMVFETDMDLRITYVNKHTLETYNFPRDAVNSGMSVLTFIHPSQHATFMESIHHLRYGIPFAPREYTAFDRAGNPFPVIVYSSPIFRNKQMVGFRGVVTDISAKKQAEQALRESEEKHRTFAELLPQIVFETDEDLRLTFVNTRAIAQFGYMPEEVASGFNALEIIAPSQHARLKKNMASLVHGESFTNEEYTLIRRDGTTFSGLIYANLVNKNGKPAGYRGIIIDNTEQKKAHEALAESEARFRDLTGNLPQMVFETDRDLRITYANRHAASVCGYTVEELSAGKPVLSLIDPSEHEKFMESVKNILANIPYEPKEYTALQKDGGRVPIVVYSSPISKNHEIAGFRGVVVDISGLRKMEEGIRESEEKFRSLIENASDIVFSLDRAGNFTYIAPQWSEILGHDIPPLIGTPSAALIHPDDLPENTRAFHSVIGNGTRIRGLEYRVRHRDGSWRWHSQSAAPLRNASGQIVSYMGICRDITDQRAAEEALRESEARLRLLTENVKDVIWTADMDMRLTYVTPSIRELRGLTPEELTGEPVEDALTPESLATIREHFRKATSELEKGEIMPAQHPLELEFRRKDGSTVWTEVMITPMLGKDGLPNGVIGLTRDISQRRASETALRESEMMFSTIFRTSLVALTLLSVKDNTFYAVNDAFIKNSGYSREEVLGKTPWEIGLLFDRENAERIAAVLKKERHIEAVEVPFRAKDGTVQVCLYSATLITMQGGIFLLSSVIDISSRKNMEEALRQANHKLNILSGITRHDINNQLQALGGYVELLRHKVPGQVHAEDFSRISRTIGQISNLIQFTKEYEMIGVHEPVWQNLHGIVAVQGKAALPKDIRCENLLPADLDIFADPLIAKVFFNLLDNAKRHGGNIREVRFTVEEKDGALVVVCSDDGVGVPPADKERIFAPGVGKNTGFGLAICREILEITGITIRETGPEGSGARFEITVPSGKHRTTVN